ncbi:MAG: ABC transporter permease [Bryobacteraceae bacterium]
MSDVRFSLRSLCRSPGFAAAAVLLLALGIGINTAMFTVVDSVLLRPLPYRQPDRVYALNLCARDAGGQKTHNNSLFNDGTCLAYQWETTSFSGIACYRSHPLNLTGSGEPVQLPAWEVGAQFFPTLGADAQLGRTFRAEDGQPAHSHVVVLSDSLWRSRFVADPEILGKTIVLDAEPYTVIGIMPPDFKFFPGTSSLWIPAVLQTSGNPPSSYLAITRLKPGVSEAAANAEVAAIAQRHAARLPLNDRHHNDTGGLVPLREMITEKARPLLLVLLGAVGFVLLIACANAATLLLARGDARRHEFAVRASLGAGRARLVRQVLSESALLSLAGGVLGFLLSLWGQDALLAMIPAEGIPRMGEIHMDFRVLGFTLLISLATALLSGLAPAIKLSRVSLNQALQRGTRSATARGHLRHVLLIAEIALSLMLLAGAGLLIKSFVRLRSVDPGFQAENVLAMSVDLSPSEYRNPAQCLDFLDRTLRRVASIPGVRSSAAINWVPFGSLQLTSRFAVESRTEEFPALMPAVTPGYFRAMGIPILRGRVFDEHDTANAPPVVILSDSAARSAWPNENPLGKRINVSERPGDWQTVVGIVGDVKQGSLGSASSEAVYQPFAQVHWTLVMRHLTFVVRTPSQPARIAPALRAELFSVDKNQPIHFLETMKTRVDASLARPRFQTQLLGAFAALALALAAVGIYGVIGYTVVLRTRELGVRIAVGAQRADILRFVLRQSLALAAIGIALGAASAAAVTRVLRSLLFEVSPLDPTTFLLVSLVLAAVAVAAALTPAYRAARVDPIIVLRYE